MLIDSHCHLDFPDLSSHLDAVLIRAREVGVSSFLTIGTSLKSWENVYHLTQRFDDVYCTVGVHPHEAEQESFSLDDLLERGRRPKVIGLGETGLDFYYEHSPRDVQETAFRLHIQAARQLNVPVVIHSRDADDVMISVLEEEQKRQPFKALLHCFSSSQRLAFRALDLGLFLSASGILTFKKSDDLRTLFAQLPLDRLLIETDAPYLAPVPHRGHINEPAYVRFVAQVLADLHGVSFQKIAEQTTQNFKTLFSL